jgi:regulator of protease activity HflC (stomatin/prohibitin superfamily)
MRWSRGLQAVARRIAFVSLWVKVGGERCGIGISLVQWHDAACCGEVKEVLRTPWLESEVRFAGPLQWLRNFGKREKKMSSPGGGFFPFLIVVAIVVLYLLSSIKILSEYERAVVFRLGRLVQVPKGPGITMVFTFIDKMVRVSLRTIVHDVPPQDIITRDNVSLKVNAVIYYRVIDPTKAVVEVEQYHYATSQLAQTTLRSVLGQVELDDLLSQREQLNHRLQEILDKHADPWGIKVSMVEVKQVDLATEMQRAIAKQAEAERGKRAKVIHAGGELAASRALAEAAQIISANPTTLQLRYLQTLAEIATEKNSTIVFPIPIDFLSGILKR